MAVQQAISRNIRGAGIGARALRHALLAGIRRVFACRDQLNRINVFPVPDGDTGTNMAFTLGAMVPAIRASRSADVGGLFRRLASDAIDGARGNSGAILAQFFQGVSEAIGQRTALDASTLVEASDLGARQARAALAQPREGTMLSVISAFANGTAQALRAGAADLRAVFVSGLASARRSLADTPRQLAVLRHAGVVDAGAQGFVDLLEGIQDFVEHGRSAIGEAIPEIEDGEVSAAASEGMQDETHRYCTECVISGAAIDRDGLRQALTALDSSSLVIAGSREKLRLHIHVDQPEQVFRIAADFGEVGARKADDMRAQHRAAAALRSQVAVVTDSAADVPESEIERLGLNVVPVRLSFGSDDLLDKVSLSSAEFWKRVRECDELPRTSQPPPGDFRRLYEFLLSHHERVLSVSLARPLSGTMQAAESAAALAGPGRIDVVDSANATAGQGLLAIHAAELAQQGMDAGAIRDSVQQAARETSTFALIDDLSFGVRGGRAPRVIAFLARLLHMRPIIRSGPDGRLRGAGGVFSRRGNGARFARWLLRRLDADAGWRILVCHCDNPVEGAALLDALREGLPHHDGAWLMEAGSAIGVHAGPGALVVGLQKRSRRKD